jgi:type I restriction enzyme M protein
MAEVTLRHDGIEYGDYIEQITFLLFLKMADERAIALPKKCDWPTLRDTSGTALIDTYTDILRTLAKQPGILGDIFTEAQCRFNKPVIYSQCDRGSKSGCLEDRIALLCRTSV